MNFPKTKLLVAGASCGEEDLQPIHIGEDTIEALSSFRYLGSILESHGEIRMNVETGWLVLLMVLVPYIDLCPAMEVYPGRRKGWFIVLLCSSIELKLGN